MFNNMEKGGDEIFDYAMNGQLIMVINMKGEFDVNQADEKEGETALSFSFIPESDTNSEISRLLLSKVANRKHMDQNGMTTLMKAAKYGRISILPEILDRVDHRYCNAKSKSGQTALDILKKFYTTVDENKFGYFVKTACHRRDLLEM
eukprot:gene1144-2211_t